MAENKKRKKRANKTATRGRKKSTSSKAPAKRRRVLSSPKKQSTRGVSRSPKKKSEEEFLIPIHTVDASASVSKKEPEEETFDVETGHNHRHSPAEGLGEVDGYSIENDLKSVSGLEKRDEHIMTKEDPIGLDLKDKKRKKSKGKVGKRVLIIFGIILGIAAIAAVVYAVLVSRAVSITGGAGVSKAKGPQTAQSGSEITYVLSLENNEQVSFEDVVFDVVYPEGFETTAVDPRASNFNQTKWEVGTIAPGATTEVTIIGTVVGAQNEDKELTTRLSYRPENMSTPFSEEMTVKTRIEALDTQFGIAGPESVTAGEEFEFEVAVENTTGMDLSNLRVKLTYPEGFEYKSSRPRPDFGVDAFDISSLTEGEEELFKIKGIVSGRTNEKLTIKAELGYINESNEFISQTEEEYDIIISEVIATIETLVFDQKTSALSSGEEMKVNVVYKNEGTEGFKNARIETRIDTKYIDTSTVEVDRGKFEDSVIIWDKDTLSDLETVEPGDEGTLSFSVKINDQIPTIDKEDKNIHIDAVSRFSSDGVEGDENKKVFIESNTAVTKINSGLSVDVGVHYFDFEGNKVGSGPLPPVKNEETKYRVYISISNTFNEVDDVVIGLQSEGNVSFTGKKSTEVGTISTNSKTATWNVGKVPAHTGRFSKNIEAYVDIIFKPTEAQVDTTPEFFVSLGASGQDMYTSQVLEPEMGSPTTALEDDAFATEGGVVQAKEIVSTDPSIISPDTLESEPFVNPDSPDEVNALR